MNAVARVFVLGAALRRLVATPTTVTNPLATRTEL